MLFTSVWAALLASAQLARGTPVQSEGGVLTTREFDPLSKDCVQGLFLSYKESDLDAMRNWFLDDTPNDNDFIAAGGWYTWVLGSVRMCVYNRGLNSTTDVEVNHKAHAGCLDTSREICCAPNGDKCRAARAPEYSVDGVLLACRVSSVDTQC